MWQKCLLAALILAAVPAAAEPPVVRQQYQLDEAQRAYERGQKLMDQESFAEAIPHFRTAIGLDPTHWLAHYSLGQAHMALKQYADAVNAYQGCREVFLNFATIDASQQNAMEKFREDEIRDLKDTILMVEQGKVKGVGNHSLEVQLNDRLRVLEGARMRGKDQVVKVPAGLMLGIGSARFRLGQMAQAEAAFQEAVATDPKLGAAHNNLAVMYMLNGRFDEAKQQIKLAEKAGTPVADTFKKELDRRAKEAGSR